MKIERSELLNGTDDGEAVQNLLHAIYHMHHERKQLMADTTGYTDLHAGANHNASMERRNKTVEVLVLPSIYENPKEQQPHVLRDPSVSRF